MYRIFIVEDDETIAAQIKKHLEGWGYGAVCAVIFSACRQRSPPLRRI